MKKTCHVFLSYQMLKLNHCIECATCSVPCIHCHNFAQRHRPAASNMHTLLMHKRLTMDKSNLTSKFEPSPTTSASNMSSPAITLLSKFQSNINQLIILQMILLAIARTYTNMHLLWQTLADPRDVGHHEAGLDVCDCAHRRHARD